MAWNEPGGNDNDPWGNRKNSGGPPDLDEVFKNLRGRLDGLFGKGGRSNGSGSGRGSSGLPGGSVGGKGLGVLGGLAAVLWALSGIYLIEPAEMGVVTQFGRHVDTVAAGPHWHLPWPIQQVQKVNVDEVRSTKLSRQLILTRDENIVKIEMSVQYNIKDAAAYLFNVREPDQTLEQALESALREVIGQNDMEGVLTTEMPVAESAATETVDTTNAGETGPIENAEDAIGIATLDSLQGILDEYRTGIHVQTVNLEQAQPPDEVQAAFSDAIKAREDKERIINEAQAYRNDVLPRARGDAQRFLEESEAYKTRVVQAATGESQRFLSLLAEFEKAPEVTRERLYIEAMESVLGNSSKVLLDSGENNGNSLMYLPVDKLIEQNRNRVPSSTGSGATSGSGGSFDSSSSSLPSSGSTDSRYSNLSADDLRTSLRSRDRGVALR